MSFRCTVVTPEQPVLDEQILQAIVPAHDGKVGLLTDRAPLLVRLGLGGLRLDLPSGEKRYFYIEGGVAQMKDNKLTILTQQATPADQIDAVSAQAELAEAGSMKISDADSFAKRQARLARARARIKLAGKA